MSSQIKLQKVEILDDGHFTLRTYELSHSQGGRDGTTLNLQLQVKTGFGKHWISFTDLAPEVQTEDTEKALDKMAEWLERAAQALRERGAPRMVVAEYGPGSTHR